MNKNPFTNSLLPVSLTLCLIVLPVQMTSASREQTIPAGPFTYHERTGDTVTPFSWRAETQEKTIVVTVKEKDTFFRNFCDSDGATHRWRMKVDGKHDITAVRSGNTLLVEGIRSGKKHREKIAIDERPWYQPLSFSLAGFLDSHQEKTSFWVIRADKIEAVSLNARKMGEEAITINGSTVDTRKVEIRPTGFYSSFWSATYWYRKSDNLFLRYRSVHGLPGTDETVVELVDLPAT